MVLLEGTLNRVMEIQAESAARVGSDYGDEVFEATVNLMSFESPRAAPLDTAHIDR